MASKQLRQLIERFEKDFTGEFEQSVLEHWIPLIRSALRREYPSNDDIYGQASRLLNVRFKSIARGARKRHRISVNRFGPELISEQYRPMLADRIRASAELIKLNRDEEIERQLRRFVGWATGGLPNQQKRDDKGELKKGVTKSLKSLSFERRRVCIDQGHKLLAAVDDAISAEYGAIAKKWRHVIPHAGYQSRKEHLELDGKVFAVKGNDAIKSGRMKKGPNGYAEDFHTQPALEPFCRCWFETIYDVSDLPQDMRA